MAHADPVRPASRRDAREMRVRRSPRRTLALATAGAAAATVLGLGGAGVTTALLADQARTGEVTVAADSMQLQINGAATSALGALTPTPATPRVVAFTVTNVSNVSVDLSAAIAATGTPTLASYTSARLTRVATSSACVAGLSGTQGALHGYAAPALGQLAAGATGTVCVEVSLAAATPPTLSSEQVPFTVTVTATQRNS